MLILGIDTSTSVCSLALYDGLKILAEWSVDNGLTHSEKLMPQLKQLLQHSNIEKSDLAGISISTGPGSFTGLRIGLATAKTIAYALKIPVCGVPTLEALAYNLPVPGIWLSPLLDGQKGNVYQALYEWQGGQLKKVQEMQFKALGDVLHFLKGSPKETILLGEVPADILASLPGHVSLALPQHLKPRAASVALAGYHKLLSGEADNIYTLEPLYVKKSEAELLWEKRKNDTQNA